MASLVPEEFSPCRTAVYDDEQERYRCVKQCARPNLRQPCQAAYDRYKDACRVTYNASENNCFALSTEKHLYGQHLDESSRSALREQYTDYLNGLSEQDFVVVGQRWLKLLVGSHACAKERLAFQRMPCIQARCKDYGHVQAIHVEDLLHQACYERLTVWMDRARLLLPEMQSRTPVPQPVIDTLRAILHRLFNFNQLELALESVEEQPPSPPRPVRKPAKKKKASKTSLRRISRSLLPDQVYDIELEQIRKALLQMVADVLWASSDEANVAINHFLENVGARDFVIREYMHFVEPEDNEDKHTLMRQVMVNIQPRLTEYLFTVFNLQPIDRKTLHKRYGSFDALMGAVQHVYFNVFHVYTADRQKIAEAISQRLANVNLTPPLELNEPTREYIINGSAADLITPVLHPNELGKFVETRKATLQLLIIQMQILFPTYTDLERDLKEYEVATDLKKTSLVAYLTMNNIDRSAWDSYIRDRYKAFVTKTASKYPRADVALKSELPYIMLDAVLLFNALEYETVAAAQRLNKALPERYREHLSHRVLPSIKLYKQTKFTSGLNNDLIVAAEQYVRGL